MLVCAGGWEGERILLSLSLSLSLSNTHTLTYQCKRAISFADVFSVIHSTPLSSRSPTLDWTILSTSIVTNTKTALFAKVVCKQDEVGCGRVIKPLSNRALQFPNSFPIPPPPIPHSFDPPKVQHEVLAVLSFGRDAQTVDSACSGKLHV